MSKVAGLALIAVASMAAPAAAQWRSMSDENPFEGTTSHYAMGFSGGPQMLGVRCETGQKKAMLYLPNPGRGR